MHKHFNCRLQTADCRLHPANTRTFCSISVLAAMFCSSLGVLLASPSKPVRVTPGGESCKRICFSLFSWATPNALTNRSKTSMNSTTCDVCPLLPLVGGGAPSAGGGASASACLVRVSALVREPQSYIHAQSHTQSE